jgi:tungstate transport system ATP-binding protein
MGVILEARDLLVRRDDHFHLSISELVVNEGQVLAVIGPNGSGKSTMLLTLNQLIKPERGEIFFHGRRLRYQDGLSFRRQVALVLQDPLLLDASVFDNVAMGLRFRRASSREIKKRVAKWLELLGISHLRNRSVKRLSGGEAQRVSLARALVLQPEILFLDEPFSSLDAPTRKRLLEDFHSLMEQMNMTAVFVTHDLDEALLLGDRIAVILDGCIRQQGTPEQVFSAPADLAVAEFVGVETVIAGQVVETQNGHVTVKAGLLQLEAVGEVEPGRQVLLCLRPEDITLWLGKQLPSSSARNQMTGKVVRMMTQGPSVRVTVDCSQPGDDKSLLIVALITRTSVKEMALSEGQFVTLTFKASAVHLITR